MRLKQTSLLACALCARVRVRARARAGLYVGQTKQRLTRTSESLGQIAKLFEARLITSNTAVVEAVAAAQLFIAFVRAREDVAWQRSAAAAAAAATVVQITCTNDRRITQQQ